MMLRIDQAFVSDFITQAFGLPIAHENVDYTPTAGTPYVEVRTFQNAVLPADLATLNDTTGLFQFILRYPEGAGAIPAKAQADTIFAAYPVGRRLTYDGQSLTITGYERPEAVPEDGWFKVLGRIYYRADIAR